jgi:hypothetical protein
VLVAGSAARRPGLALVVLSVIEQRYRAVADGALLTEVAAEARVSRQSVMRGYGARSSN